jgi:hypothetical protein
MQNKFRSGDVGFSRGSGIISKVILFFTSMQTGAAYWSHVYGHIAKGKIIEAVHKTKINDARKYEGQEIAVYRLPLTEVDQRAFDYGARRIAGRAYGWLKLPLFAADAIATFALGLMGHQQPVYFFTSAFGIFHLPVCSQLYVYILHKFTNARIADETGNPVPWRTVSPDRLEDLLKLPGNKAVLIYTTRKAPREDKSKISF